MQDEKLQDVTWLFDFASEWYTKNPGEQISLYDWQKKVAQDSENTAPLVFYVGFDSIRITSHDIIPSLALIGIQAEPEAVLASIKHHDVTCYHIAHTFCESTYGDNYDDYSSLESLTWEINQAFIRVIMLDDQLSQDFINEYINYGLNDDLEMAWLEYDSARFWPVTLVNHHLDSLSKGKINSNRKAPEASSSYVFEKSSLRFNSLTDNKIIKLLDRSGNLTLGITAENGYEPNRSNSFFCNLLLALDKKGPSNSNIVRTLEAINRLQDEEMIAVINARLLESLTEGSSRTFGGVRLFECMHKFLDEQRYGSIRQNLVLNLKLLNLGDLILWPFPTMSAFYGNSQINKIGESPISILEQLLSDLKALNPQDFRRPHFEAIDALLSTRDFSPNQTKNTLNELLCVALNALDAYRPTINFHGKLAKIESCIESASSALAGLARLVASTKEIDYDRYKRFNSASKALLASNGFEIKKLPGITPRHRGQVLDDQLGL
jgi:hypothetical protein